VLTVTDIDGHEELLAGNFDTMGGGLSSPAMDVEEQADAQQQRDLDDEVEIDPSVYDPRLRLQKAQQQQQQQQQQPQPPFQWSPLHAAAQFGHQTRVASENRLAGFTVAGHPVGGVHHWRPALGSVSDEEEDRAADFIEEEEEAEAAGHGANGCGTGGPVAMDAEKENEDGKIDKRAKVLNGRR
jgi:hypothetical protein